MAVVVALLAGAAAWFIGAPAVRHGSVPPPPEIDIDPPALRARRDAAIAAAKMPGDPWTFAESLAPSAPDRPARPGNDDCGLDDAPQFADTDSTAQGITMTRGATPRYLAVQARMDAALRTSADPLDRVAADFVNAGDLRSQAGSDQAVVQEAALSADPRLVSLGHAMCTRMSPATAGCEVLTAQRWAQVDAGNGMPWIELLAQARERGNAVGVQEAMSHLAAATRFDTHFYALPAVVARSLPDDARDLAAGSDLLNRAVERVATLDFPPFKPLLDVCRDEANGDPQRALQCRAISDGMYAHSDTALALGISGALMFQTTGDASRRESIKAERAIRAAHWSPATGLSRCGTMRDGMHKLIRNAEIGEVEAMREEARKSVAP